jgi:SHS2 domain-containing protein
MVYDSETRATNVELERERERESEVERAERAMMTWMCGVTLKDRK